MAKVKATTSSTPKKKGRPALTPEARENQMISLAVDLAEQQLRDGTASSQVITHFLKLGTTTAQLEKVKLENENKLIIAKAEALRSEKNREELMREAMRMMAVYNGKDESDED